MLQCRRNEKDFMLRKDTKYLDKLGKNVEALLLEADEIKEMAEQVGYDEIAEDTMMFSTAIADYKANFTQLVEGRSKSEASKMLEKPFFQDNASQKFLT